MIFELRNYQLRPGTYADFLDYFETVLIAPQEACGMNCVGQFYCPERPDRFIWMRAFSDMQARLAALEAFYGGPDWAEKKGPANALMTAWDDVYLVKPAPGLNLPLHQMSSGSRPEIEVGLSLEVLLIDVPRSAHEALAHELTSVGDWLAAMVPVDAPNEFEALPVHDAPERMVVVGNASPLVVADIVRSSESVIEAHGATIVDRYGIEPSEFSRARWSG